MLPVLMLCLESKNKYLNTQNRSAAHVMGGGAGRYPGIPISCICNFKLGWVFVLFSPVKCQDWLQQYTSSYRLTQALLVGDLPGVVCIANNPG